MKSPVIIKGNKYGFQIVLNPTLTFEELLAAVEEKFRATDRFFDENRTMAVSFEGRSLSPGEQNLLVDTITSCCRLRIGYIIEGAAAVETSFAQALQAVLPGNGKTEEKVEKVEQVPAEEEIPSPAAQGPAPEVKSADLKSVDHNTIAEAVVQSRGAADDDGAGKNAQFYRGTLRSGQKIEVEGSLVILGDINPGAQVVAGGNVVILGCLKGIVYAGYPSDKSAFVSALVMDPMQIQIGNCIARAPDTEKKKKKLRRKRKAEELTAMIAFVEENNIFIEKISRELITELSNI